MRFADSSQDPQSQHSSDTTPATEETKIDHAAAEMASKAGSVEKAGESSDTVGGVRSNSGGIFSK